MKVKINHKHIQYGCGLCAPSTWLNFDVSPALRIQRIPGKFYKGNVKFPLNVRFGDIVKGLPIRDYSCKVVYCSHVLEHLSFEDFRVALKNTYRILEKDGIFRFVLPDLEYLVKKYISNKSPDAAHIFMKQTLLGKEQRRHGLKGFIVEWFGNDQHLWMYDYKFIESELQNAGFITIRRTYFGDSSEAIFKEVEGESQWLNSLGIECKK